MIAALPSIAEQVRSAAACAAQARTEAVRAVVGARTDARAAKASALRLMLLQLIAAQKDITTRQIYLRVLADLKVSESSVHHIVYDLRDRGWVVSHVAPNRKGIRIGTGRVNSWRITTLGRYALETLEADRAQSTDPTPATTGEH